MNDATAPANPVLRVADSDVDAITALLRRFGLVICCVAEDAAIPASYWGDCEAGLIGNTLYVRADTPLHSVLHEAAHYICMDDERRVDLQRDAGGDCDEENAVCYLQCLLADAVPGLGRDRMWQDMDAWGYTFRLGSARTWFESDAEDSRHWLEDSGIIDGAQQITWRIRVDRRTAATCKQLR